MNINYKKTVMKKILMLITIAVLFYSCDKFDDTNISPTLLTQASTKALLTNSQQSISEMAFGNVAASRLAAM